ncbi:hypothetical protein HDU86_000900 [Geranomyces michiganensis]|nr:hypothetical protein HDU86_000900 [Geranomyces michiganensis]
MEPKILSIAIVMLIMSPYVMGQSILDYMKSYVDTSVASTIKTVGSCNCDSAKYIELSARISKLEALLNGVTRSPNIGGTGSDLIFNGLNVVVNNGANDPRVTNGLGNVVIGYNNINVASSVSGSHNIVIGMENKYTGYSNLVSGAGSIASGNVGAILGGQFNEMGVNFGVMAGGSSNVNKLNSFGVSVGGMNHVLKAGSYGVIMGGKINTVGGNHGVMIGGQLNSVNGSVSVLVGGDSNSVGGELSLGLSGQRNVISDRLGSGYRRVSIGGMDNTLDINGAIQIGNNNNIASASSVNTTLPISTNGSCGSTTKTGVKPYMEHVVPQLSGPNEVFR